MFTNIYSKGAWPANKLSNFASHPFRIDGVNIASMESFLQSTKFRDPDRQREVCQFPAKEAKAAGEDQCWSDYLYWRGVPYRRKGYEYHHLVSRAYDTMAAQNPSFQTALIGSSPILLHTVGKWRRSKTCLTWWEFCHILTRLRRRIRP